jgi:hypothetical protein
MLSPQDRGWCSGDVVLLSTRPLYRRARAFAAAITSGPYPVRRTPFQGFTVHGEPLEVRANSADRYHVLTMWDVVEHLPDPREELAAARMLLVPGGRLYLSTIDTGSLVARVLGARWPWLMDMHLVYFDRPTISALLEEAGFVAGVEAVFIRAVGLPLRGLRPARPLPPALAGGGPLRVRVRRAVHRVARIGKLSRRVLLGDGRCRYPRHARDLPSDLR